MRPEVPLPCPSETVPPLARAVSPVSTLSLPSAAHGRWRVVHPEALLTEISFVAIVGLWLAARPAVGRRPATLSRRLRTTGCFSPAARSGSHWLTSWPD